MPSSAPAAPSAIDLVVLTQFLNSLQSFSQDLVQHLHSGQTLCHYTSLDGAVGIISSGDLWLSNSRFSNDDEELNYGYEIVDAVLEGFEREAASDRRPWFERLRSQVKAARGDHVYICSFCQKNNLLSQWRGYADNGGGVSIEFDHVGFQAVAGPDCPHGLMRLWKVFYNREQQRQIIKSCVDYPWASGSENGDIRHIVGAIQFFVPTFKNTDFEEEQERRLIFTPHLDALPKPRFRSRGGMLVPYYSLRELANWPVVGLGPRLPIRSVLVGPGGRRSLNVESMKMMLGAHGYVGIPVDASTTPYRG